ncbi:MAG: ClbS/DfsB family four-helix bundle protein [Anaerolineales bacterium]|nr:ClbS/DfsB family four-helix bundle protein [Anaerolineales bacterium]
MAPALKPKLIEWIKRIDREEQSLFVHLSESERSVRGEPDRWSPKDVLAHLAAWKERMAANLAAMRRGEARVKYDNYEEINAEEFAEFRDSPWTEILAKAAEANRRLLEQIEAAGEADLNAMWDDKRQTWKSIAGTGYVHPVIHLGQVYLERDAKEYATDLQESAAAALTGLGAGSRWDGTVKYNLACHYALIGEKGKAVGGLKEALELNPDLREWSKEDPDFASIRETPEYLALYKE